MAKKRATYHHGDLKTALIHAADEIIAESGIEGFSLRAAAQRAGVSPGAPAHHFGSAKGLLTEVALLAFAKADEMMKAVERADNAAANMRAISYAFVQFAYEHPGHFRLMFRHDLIDRKDPRYKEATEVPGKRLGAALEAYHGKAEKKISAFEHASDEFAGLALLHGMADMVIAEKIQHMFPRANAGEFVEKDLPKVLKLIYPDR
ncbi:TetR/AcrR family transcriptional regulator [Granulicella cerasi]|uniref:TetR/AcrR family transcriptional regulator n=1 Tax=Granulicella cerasi TaxID=741063 RepID=A0ABW1ZD18_9BACT|nr:TetR/AcrR family transcriptional regulator [Granulicella cerasi]